MEELTVGGFSCGIGNLLGFHQDGYKVKFIIDDRSFIEKGKKTFLNNFYGCKFYPDLDDIRRHYLQNPDVIISSPSCAQVSPLGMKREDRETLNYTSIENFTFYTVLSKLLKLDADFVIVEYLIKLLKHLEIKHHGLYRAATDEFFPFPKNYRVQILRLNSLSYGVPQKRERLFIFFSKKKYNFVYVPPSDDRSFKEWTIQEVLEYLDEERAKRKIFNDEAPSHSQERIDRFNELKFGESYYGGANNRRLDPRKVAPTITSHCTQYVHPYEPRVLTVREVATFQGFPLDFVFYGPNSTQLDLVGRSISPMISKHFAEEIRICIEKYRQDINLVNQEDLNETL